MFKSGVMSNKTIEKNIGKNIFIYPYNPYKMNGGSTYNLTASIIAYYRDDNNSGKYIYAVKYDNQTRKNYIIIPAHKTIFIQTNESIYVTNKICGTYHSKVKRVSEGLSHIGTTLDPEYFGTSLLAIQNTTEKEIRITVGDTFVSLMFYKMTDKADSKHDNAPGRSDLGKLTYENTITLDGSNLEPEILGEIEKWYGELWRNNISELKRVCKSEFRKTQKGKKIIWINKVDFWITFLSSIIIFGFVLLNYIFKFADLNYVILISIVTFVLGSKTYIINNYKEKVEGY